MGRKAVLSGIKAIGRSRIQFDFEFQGVRYRPTLERTPTEANLRRAFKQLQDIRQRITLNQFSFQEEFPEYRHPTLIAATVKPKTCNDVFARFLAHSRSRMKKHDLSFATCESYRRILKAVWAPTLGERAFEEVRYSDLAAIADAGALTKKTYNNQVSTLKCAFEFGYRDHPEKHNPADGLTCFRITKKDRPVVDPFSVPEAELIIAAMHERWGEAQGNYDEFRCVSGLRISEEIALEVDDCDVVRGRIRITKARVMAQDKDRTKTSEDRTVELCPRAIEVLKAQLALRERLRAQGLIHHRKVFFHESGAAWHDTQVQQKRWMETVRELDIRYREPNNARHTSVSWNLMIGKNPLWVSKNHGHGVQTMLEVYAAWIEGTDEVQIEAIKQALTRRPIGPFSPLHSPRAGNTLATGMGVIL